MSESRTRRRDPQGPCHERPAADHGLTVPETLAALDKHPIELDRDQFLRRRLALELIELDQLWALAPLTTL